ncbi:hypothetical protein CYL21_3487 [Plasmodium falciparum NF54]|uniref:Uncharacterized protein n=2 Tax=Plasmodium falciparum TaxID=5833 RepID=Q8I2D5_PLAF7|nr:Plasmodium exported protein (hyp10), unknown function [Plasmodium falciparum 3D7]KAF4328277.1 hypothetical protein CYL21_3487 [Plasmodium falciparum NF54]PKC48123.1 hypothetical protein CK202_2244 [Plasmodium falciparum NF54]CAD48956.1 Plasmodium exported protein (hyp10), unknown function [Plasmodium falciparum 3D7]|eukprot:XP_001351068.1 Plasmodium exported protein (hyp10), unknown function [Plasmodium falciparum 3D7]
MSFYYFKLSFISILLCILIITHKFSLEQITHNKSNNFNIINVTHRRLLAEPHKSHILKTHKGENSMAQPIVNKLRENHTECPKKSSSIKLKKILILVSLFTLPCSFFCFQ